MSRLLLLAYIIIFAVASVGLEIAHAVIVPAHEKKNDPWWDTPVDLILMISALAGMVFLFVDLQNPTVKTLWKPLSLVILVGQVYLNLRARIAWLRSPQDAKGRETLVRAADLSALALVAPSSVLNLVYAFR
jgi:hypothetical protein